MVIKHLVLCGGGHPVGFVQIGALLELQNKKIIKYKNIKSIYSTSIGGYTAFMYMLNFKEDWIYDFIVERPWNKLIQYTSSDYLNLYYTKGLMNEETIIDILKPLFLAADLKLETTLQEFYDINYKEWHLITCKLNTFEFVDLSYKTHPDLTVIQAIIMSSAIPIIVKPPVYNGEIYFDGGIYSNNPINICLHNQKCKRSHVLAFINDKRKIECDISNNMVEKTDISNNNIDNNNINIITYLLHIFKNIIYKFTCIELENLIQIKYIINVCIDKSSLNLEYWLYSFSNKDEREKLVSAGKKLANNFIKKNTKS